MTLLREPPGDPVHADAVDLGRPLPTAQRRTKKKSPSQLTRDRLLVGGEVGSRERGVVRPATTRWTVDRIVPFSALPARHCPGQIPSIVLDACLSARVRDRFHPVADFFVNFFPKVGAGPVPPPRIPPRQPPARPRRRRLSRPRAGERPPEGRSRPGDGSRACSCGGGTPDERSASPGPPRPRRPDSWPRPRAGG